MSQDAAIFCKQQQRCRISGALTLLLYLAGSLLTPLSHMLEYEHIEHSHAWNLAGGEESHAPHHHHRNMRQVRQLLSRGEVKASDFLDGESGRIDLRAFSVALGLAEDDEGPEHEGCQNSPTHDPFTHADHVEEHFGLAYLSVEGTQVLPIALDQQLPGPQPLASLTLPPRPAYLNLSYPQGPPGQSI